MQDVKDLQNRQQPVASIKNLKINQVHTIYNLIIYVTFTYLHVMFYRYKRIDVDFQESNYFFQKKKTCLLNIYSAYNGITIVLIKIK